MRTSAAGPVRYFAVVGLHPTYALLALASVVIIGLATIWLDQAALDSGLGMILFAQMFLASTGFMPRARQGHFDPLLTGPFSRTRIAAAHWLMSIAPGAGAWLVVAAAASLLGSSSVLSAVAGSRAVALLIVSTVSWALGFGLPRGAAGMIWSALLMVLVTQRVDVLAAPIGASVLDAGLRHFLAVVVCPFVLLGHPVLAVGALPAASVIPIAALLLVVRRSRGLDICLVERG